MCFVRETGQIWLSTLNTFIVGLEALACQVLQVLWDRVALGALLSLGAGKDQLLEETKRYGFGPCLLLWLFMLFW